jgi:hypothetical protein
MTGATARAHDLLLAQSMQATARAHDLMLARSVWNSLVGQERASAWSVEIWGCYARVYGMHCDSHEKCAPASGTETSSHYAQLYPGVVKSSQV